MIEILDFDKCEILPTLSFGKRYGCVVKAIVGTEGKRSEEIDRSFIESVNSRNTCNPCRHFTVDGRVYCRDYNKDIVDNGPIPKFKFFGQTATHVGSFADSWQEVRENRYGVFTTTFNISQSQSTNLVMCEKHVHEDQQWHSGSSGSYDNFTTTVYTRRKGASWDVLETFVGQSGEVSTRTWTTNSFWKTRSAQPMRLIPSPEYILTKLPVYGELKIDDIIDDLCNQLQHVNVNSLAYIKDFAGMADMVSSTLSAIKHLENPKSWADLFLSTKYGWKMTYLDTMELCGALGEVAASAVPRFSKVSSSRALEGSWDERLSCTVDNSASPGNSLRQLIAWGLWPTATNLWDFVPFSFVVNWLTGVQGIFRALDNNLLLSCLSVSDICHSLKFTGTIRAHEVHDSLVGNLNVRYYNRQVWDSIPFQRFRFDNVNGLSGHGAETTALIVQKVLS